MPRAVADAPRLQDLRCATARGEQGIDTSTLGTPMNQFDLRQAAGTEPAERSQPLTDSPRGEDPGDRLASWDGYSPDTLAALDEHPSDVW
jgi:hypothetical protein